MQYYVDSNIQNETFNNNFVRFSQLYIKIKLEYKSSYNNMLAHYAHITYRNI